MPNENGSALGGKRHMLIIPAFGRRRQEEGQECKVILGYIMSSGQLTITSKKKKLKQKYK